MAFRIALPPPLVPLVPRCEATRLAQHPPRHPQSLRLASFPPNNVKVNASFGETSMYGVEQPRTSQGFCLRHNQHNYFTFENSQTVISKKGFKLPHFTIKLDRTEKYISSQQKSLIHLCRLSKQLSIERLGGALVVTWTSINIPGANLFYVGFFFPPRPKSKCFNDRAKQSAKGVLHTYDETVTLRRCVGQCGGFHRYGSEHALSLIGQSLSRNMFCCYCFFTLPRSNSAGIGFTSRQPAP